MRHRDLTVRVYGPFSDTRYATLAHKIGSHLIAMGLAGHAVLVPDETISAADVENAARHISHPPHSVRRNQDSAHANNNCADEAACESDRGKRADRL